MCSPKWLTFHNHYVWPHCESTCSPNWFDHKVNDDLRYGKKKTSTRFPFSLGCFVNEICMENREKKTPDFHFPFCWVFWSRKLTSQSLQHWRQIGHKKPLSVAIKSYIGNWIWNVRWPNCENHTTALFWILQNVFQISFFRCLWPWILVPFCNVQYLSEKKTGMATKSTHLPYMY